MIFHRSTWTAEDSYYLQDLQVEEAERSRELAGN